MRCEETRELITALVDNELPQQERFALEGHLRDCARCRFVYEQEQALKRGLRLAASRLSAPASLRERVLSELSVLPRTIDLHEGWKGLFWGAKMALRPALVLAVLVLLILPALYLLQPKGQPISLAALETHERILKGEIPVIRAGSAEEIKGRLRRSVEGRFGPMGYDLSMMNLVPVAGAVQEVGGRKILVTVYEGQGISLICYTFLGSENDAPANASLFFDPEKKMNFYTFSRGRFNGVLHREGKVICLLAAEMPMQELLALARAKAQPS